MQGAASTKRGVVSESSIDDLGESTVCGDGATSTNRTGRLNCSLFLNLLLPPEAVYVHVIDTCNSCWTSKSGLAPEGLNFSGPAQQDSSAPCRSCTNGRMDSIACQYLAEGRSSASAKICPSRSEKRPALLSGRSEKVRQEGVPGMMGPKRKPISCRVPKELGLSSGRSGGCMEGGGTENLIARSGEGASLRR